jgi:hypothetical protein
VVKKKENRKFKGREQTYRGEKDLQNDQNN